MSLLKPDVWFPYCDIHTVYLKCDRNEQLKQIFLKMIKMIYFDCIDAVYPITRDDIQNGHMTYGISVVTSEHFYRTFAQNEVYPWHINPIAITVPYGNILEWDKKSNNWLAMTARTLRSAWHGMRLIPNDTPELRKYVNVGIPWIPRDRKPEECTEQELYDYAEIILSNISPQIWVQDRQIITPHVHVS